MESFSHLIRVELFSVFMLLIVVSVMLSSDVYAQKQNVKFEHITTEQGLPSNTVNCILQDSKEFIWIGTNAGLARYDGYSFTLYNNNPFDSTSLSNNWINDIYKDPSGVFWIGTNGGGLCRMNRDDGGSVTFVRYQKEKGNVNSLRHDNVSVIYGDSLGEIWIGTEGGGMSRLNWDDQGGEIFTHYQSEDGNPNSLKDNWITDIYRDRTGVLWIGTWSGGLSRLVRDDRGKETFKHYRHEEGNPNSLGDDNVRAIYEDRTGVLWIGIQNGGLNKFDRESETFFHYWNDKSHPNSLSSNSVEVIYEDRSGGLWIGTESGGLYRMKRDDHGKEIFTRYKNEIHNPKSLSDDRVIAICEDRSGVLWIGTFKGGLNKLNRRKNVFSHWTKEPDSPNTLSDSHVLAICEERSNAGRIYWIGTRRGGLNRFDRERGIFQHYKRDENNPNSLSDNYVLAVCEDHLEALWIGTYSSGLDRFDPKSGTFTHYKNKKSNPNSLVHNRVRTIYEDRSGILWIGTRGGLDRYDPGFNREGKGIFIHYRHEEGNPISLCDNSVRIIYEDREGVLWIGTDGGLSRVNRDDREKVTFTNYRHEDGNLKSLSYNRVRSIYEDPDEIGSTLWIGTRGGLNKFDPETEEFTHYTEENGLPSNVVYGILEDDLGNLWLSTTKGLSRFNLQTETFRNYDVNDGLQDNEFELGAYCLSQNGEMFFGGINGFNTFYPDSVKDNLHIPPIVITAFKIFDKNVKFDQDISTLKEIELSCKENFISFEFAALDYVNSSRNQYAYKLEGFDPDWIYCGTRRYVSYTSLGPGEYVFRVKGSNNDGVWNEEGVSIKLTITPPFWHTWWFRGSGLLFVLFSTLSIYRIRTHNIRKRNRQLEEINIKLNEQITERKRAEEQIKASLKEKELLLREVHHRVKNNLQVISSLLNIQSRFVRDKHAREMYKESQSRVRSMALIHEKLYQSTDLARIDFAGYIQSLAKSLQFSYGTDPERIVINVKVKSVSLGIYLAVPCGLIINELVSNALKHAFPPSWKGRGEIEVSLLAAENNEIELIVSDNGVGLPKDFDFRKTDSLGLHLVTILVEDQLNGEISIERREGTKFRIKFKEKLS